MLRRVVVAPSSILLSFVALGLTGCPLSDRYYVEKDKIDSSGGTAGNTSDTTTHSGGSSGTNNTSDTGSENGGTSDGGTSSVCDASSCSNSCCGGVCVDLDNDTNHCGKCDNECPAGRECRTGRCYGWTTMSIPTSFVAREKAAYASLDDKLFIFGGIDADGNVLNDGALYDPVTDSWSLVPITTSTPSARLLASAIWTGKAVYVVGGTDKSETMALTSGAKYDPAAQTWTKLPDLTTGRVAPYLANAVTAGHVLVWGGLNASGAPLSGGAYCLYYCQNWTPLSSGPYPGAPGQLAELTWVAGNNGVLLFGGLSGGTTSTNNAYQYAPASYQWSALMGMGPSPRWGAFGVWDSQSFYVWGGRNETAAFDDGSRYVSSGGWSTMGATNVPSARWAPHRRTGWLLSLAAGDIVMVGGMSFNGTLLTNGGRYNKSTTEWTAIASWLSGETHEYGVAGSVGGEVFVWGGRNGSRLTATGERFLP